jgi:hypothetical protein
MHVTGPRPLLVLATCSLVASPPASAQSRSVEPARLRAAEIDFASLAPLTRSVMQHELALVLAPASLAPSWRRAPPEAETDPDEIRVVLLRSGGAGTDRGALGSAARRGLAPTIWVYVPNVAGALDLDLDGVATSLEAQRLMGVALGRVLAHEVVHVLAPEVGHARTGMMRSRLNSSHLASGRPALEGDCAAALAKGARAWLAAGGRRRAGEQPGLGVHGPIRVERSSAER